MFGAGTTTEAQQSNVFLQTRSCARIRGRASCCRASCCRGFLLVQAGKLCLVVDMPLTSPQLPAVGLVSELSKEDRDSLSAYGSFHFAHPGDVLIQEGASHGKLFFIISGLLHARHDGEGRDLLLGPIRQGEWVGEVDLFDPASAVCSVVVMEPSQYWMITRADLEDFINNYPEAGIQILIGVAGTLGRRLRGVTKKLTEQNELAAIRNSLFES